MARDILWCTTRLSIGTVNINDVIHTLEKQTTLLTELYKCDYLKPNPDKWHLILSERDPTLHAHAGSKRILFK